MATVELRDIVNLGDRAAVMGLRRGPGQDQYLNSMEEIFAEADEEQRAMPHPWAVHDAETGALVGFAMISDNVPEPMDDDLVGPYALQPSGLDGFFDHFIRSIQIELPPIGEVGLLAKALNDEAGFLIG